MTVALNSLINSYIGNGLSNSFPFTFPVFNPSQLLVLVTGPTGAGYTLTLGVDYSVSGLNAAGSPATTGTIILTNASQVWLTGGNLSSGWAISIQSNFPVIQATSIRNQGDFDRAALEDALDYITYLLQQNSTFNFTITDIVTGYVYRMEMINGVWSQVRIA